MPATEPNHSAPEGAFCAQHPQRPAAFTCPRCGNYACLFCWHDPVTRCDSCLKRDPAAAAPAIPWETHERSVVQRYVATMLTALHPRKSAPAFAQADLRLPFRFFALCSLPLAALSGIIPNTKTLLFAGPLQLIVQGKPTPQAIALDVLAAMLMQIAAFAIDMLALGLPYTSLVRAYAPERRAVALRTLYYRSWLVPAATLIFFLGMWCLPSPPPNATEPPPMLLLPAAVPFVFNLGLFVSMRDSARLAAGIGPALSYVVVIVAFIVRFFVQKLVEVGAHGLFPTF
jgi:hypothetical protein